MASIPLRNNGGILITLFFLLLVKLSVNSPSLVDPIILPFSSLL